MCSCWEITSFSNFKRRLALPVAASGSTSSRSFRLAGRLPSACSSFRAVRSAFCWAFTSFLPGASGGSSSSANCSFEVRGCSVAASLALLDSENFC